MADVIVIGSVNVDTVYRVEAIPRPGETVMSTSESRVLGGKGANQAIASAAAGVGTALVGQVGSDTVGDRIRVELDALGLDLSHLGCDDAVSTGAAVIVVDGGGENSIVVWPGANRALTPTDVALADDAFAGAAVVLASLEVPLEAVARGFEPQDRTRILNPAPWCPLPPALLSAVDILTPNETEMAALLDRPVPADLATTSDLAADIVGQLGSPDAAVVATLGRHGALIVDRKGARHVEAPEVEVVDTTGAGDCLNGTLAARLARGDDLDVAVERAVAAATASVTRPGATGVDLGGSA